MANFTMKKNDHLPILAVICRDASGAVVDLTGAVSAKFMMAATVGGATKVNAAATIVSPSGGQLQYSWVTGDTDTAGTFNGEFQVTFAGPKLLTFPNADYISIQIVADIAQ